MPVPISDSSIKIIWENNPDSPLTSTNLSKTVDYISSYQDFEDGYEKQSSIITRDPTDPFRLIMKRGTILSIINEAQDPPLSGNYVVPINEQYRVFDFGLEDIWLTVNDRDDDLSIPAGQWGDNKEWFIYLCDKDDTSEVKAIPGDYGGGAQILISRNISYPTGQVPGRPANNYSVDDTRKIGGFKTNASSEIILDSVWDISGKVQKVKAKGYYIIDENNADSEDTFGRHLYRPLRVSDLDSTLGPNNIFDNDVTIKGDFSVQPVGGGTNKFNIDNTSNLISAWGNISILDTAAGDEIFAIDASTPSATFTGNLNVRPTAILPATFSVNGTTGEITSDGGISIGGTWGIDSSGDSVVNVLNISGTIALTDNHLMTGRELTFRSPDNIELFLEFQKTTLDATHPSWYLKHDSNNKDFSIGPYAKSEFVVCEYDTNEVILPYGNLRLQAGGPMISVGNTTPSGVTVVGMEGYFYATRVYNAVYNDLAEYFLSNDKEEAGKIYVLGKNGKVELSKKRADKNVIGVCSDSFAYVMKSEYQEGGVPLTLSGTIKTFVKTKINIGDELVSNVDGFATKANIFERIFKRSSIMGKALEDNINEEKRILIKV